MKPVSFYLEMGASNHDKRGFITVDTLKKGEYVFGYKNFYFPLNPEVLSVEPILHVYPNPASGFVRIVLPENRLSSGMLSLYSFNGELLRTVKTSPEVQSYVFNWMNCVVECTFLHFVLNRVFYVPGHLLRNDDP